MEVYVLSSGDSLQQIEQALSNAGGAAVTKIIFKKNDSGAFVETKQTIIVCTEKTYNNLCNNSSYGNRLNPYDWSRFWLPSEEKQETWSLHISGLPQTWTIAQAEEFVHAKIGKVIPASLKEQGTNQSVPSYTLNFKLETRESGRIMGFGKIEFHDDVNDEDIQIAKLLLHNSSITVGSGKGASRHMISSIWHTNSKKDYKKKVFNPREEKTTGAESASASSTTEAPQVVQQKNNQRRTFKKPAEAPVVTSAPSPVTILSNPAPAAVFMQAIPPVPSIAVPSMNIPTMNPANFPALSQ
ncbi:MAG: hypothetical protein Solivirus3_7 [Solivirus sp.]|uniref:Uncharacterized protein n=1 Tax=Solivirus sp. TaxID=2487772 RepID=A0A3G5AFQ4_9VIRU|nr:MAG: hypothetical protein Solivirus3_7 [Solivirus sp.]